MALAPDWPWLGLWFGSGVFLSFGSCVVFQAVATMGPEVVSLWNRLPSSCGMGRPELEPRDRPSVCLSVCPVGLFLVDKELAVMRR